MLHCTLFVSWVIYLTDLYQDDVRFFGIINLILLIPSYHTCVVQTAGHIDSCSISCTQSGVCALLCVEFLLQRTFIALIIINETDVCCAYLHQCV